MHRPIFGRERELKLLESALESARAGSGRLLRLTGEPGIGKTRLADAFLESARGVALRIGWARCWEHSGTTPFALFIDVLHSLYADRTELSAALGSGAGSLFRELPAEQSGSRRELFEALCRALTIPSTDAATLVIFDDIHAADLDSLEVLTCLGPRLRTSTTLALATQRSVESGASNESLARLRELGRVSDAIELEGLSTDAIRRWLEEATGRHADPRMAEAIGRRTLGNPLFVDGVVRGAVREGTLETGTLQIAADVREQIASRVAAAGVETTRVLNAAAVLGRPFTAEFVAGVLRTEPATVALALELGVAHSLIVPPELGLYAFRHALVGEALAAAISSQERARLHNRIAEVLEATEHGTAMAELAQHRQGAIPVAGAAPAIAALRTAAQHASSVFSHSEAARQLRTALAIGEAHHFPDPEIEQQLRLEIGEAELLAGRRGDARHTLLGAIALARRSGDAAALARAALGIAETGEFGHLDREKLAILEEALSALGPHPSPTRVRLLARLAAELWVDPAAKSRREALSESAVRAAREVGNQELLRAALEARFQALWGPSGATERRRIAEELEALAQNSGSVEFDLAHLRHSMVCALEHGDLPTFERSLTALANLAQRLRRPALEETVMQRRVTLALVHGDFEAAERLAEQMRALGIAVQNPQAEMGYRFVRSDILLGQNRLNELRPVLEGLEQDADRLSNLPFLRARTAELSAVLGRGEQAERYLVRFIRDYETEDLTTLASYAFAARAAILLQRREVASDLVERITPHAHLVATVGSTLCFGAISLSLGELLLLLGDAEAAHSAFERAHAIHLRMKSKRYSELSALALAKSVAHHKVPAAAAGRRSAPGGARLERVGDAWLLEYAGLKAQVRDARGMWLLADLLASPGREYHSLDLAGAHGIRRASGQTDAPLLDAAAKARIRDRLRALGDRRVDAEERGDREALARARAEIEEIEEYLAQAVGLGGRDRKGGSAERARIAVTKALKRAISSIEAVLPAAGAHLERSVRTGAFCAYDPDPLASVDWTVITGR